MLNHLKWTPSNALSHFFHHVWRIHRKYFQNCFIPSKGCLNVMRLKMIRFNLEWFYQIIRRRNRTPGAIKVNSIWKPLKIIFLPKLRIVQKYGLATYRKFLKIEVFWYQLATHRAFKKAVPHFMATHSSWMSHVFWTNLSPR